MQVDSLPWFVAAWVVGGVVAFCGATCFAELTTAYNEDGGDYVYLREAFGRYVAFLFAWTAGWIIRPANIAAMAVTFALFAQRAGSWLSDLGEIPLAIMAVVALSLLNLGGIQLGRWAQNILTAAKVLGLLLLVGIGFWPMPTETGDNDSQPSPQVVAAADAPQVAATPPGDANTNPVIAGDSEPLDEETIASTAQQPPVTFLDKLFGLQMALVFVLYTFGGWNDVSFVAAEVRNPKRNLPLALMVGLGVVTLVYLLVNSVLIANLGLDGLASSENAPTDVVARQMNAWGLGDWITRLLGTLVSVSCLGAVNAMLITSPRIYYAAGKDHHWLGWFATWNHETETPTRALVGQTVATVLMLLICAGLNSNVLMQMGWKEMVFKDANPFEELVSVSSPFFWFFLALVGIGMMVLRVTDATRPRPVRAFAYPLTPVIFTVSSLFMGYRSFSYALFDRQFLVSFGLVATVFTVALLLGWTGFKSTSNGKDHLRES